MLAGTGERVRVITRSGGGPDHPLIERVKADAANDQALERAAVGATVIYSAGSPPYDRWVTDWPPLAASVLGAAEKTGAVLVLVGNLYGYGPVDHRMVETDPLNATAPKGRVRAAIWDLARTAHEQGRVRATELRSSDYYGPQVVLSQMGERIVPRILAGKSVRVVCSPDVPHTWTFINDVARTLIVIGGEERAWGHAWHAPSNPPLSQRQMIHKLCFAAGVEEVRVGSIAPLALAALGVFSPMIREIRETTYQLDRPFVMDASATEAAFDLTATALEPSLTDTVTWFRNRRRGPD